MTSEILKVTKPFNYPPDLEETPLINFFQSKKQQTNFYLRDGVDSCVSYKTILRVI